MEAKYLCAGGGVMVLGDKGLLPAVVVSRFPKL